MYYNQKKNAKARNYALPNYSMVELREWVYSQPNFNELYDNWVKSGFDKNLSPSCDRLDDYKPYSFDNLQIVTWKQNLKNEWNRRKKGENAKVAVRNIRRDLNEDLKALKKDIAEDILKAAETDIQKVTDATIKKVEDIINKSKDD
jgi:hypothetical protein